MHVDKMSLYKYFIEINGLEKQEKNILYLWIIVSHTIIFSMLYC